MTDEKSSIRLPDFISFSSPEISFEVDGGKEVSLVTGIASEPFCEIYNQLCWNDRKLVDNHARELGLNCHVPYNDKSTPSYLMLGEWHKWHINGGEFLKRNRGRNLEVRRGLSRSVIGFLKGRNVLVSTEMERLADEVIKYAEGLLAAQRNELHNLHPNDIVYGRLVQGDWADERVYYGVQLECFSHLSLIVICRDGGQRRLICHEALKEVNDKVPSADGSSNPIVAATLIMAFATASRWGGPIGINTCYVPIAASLFASIPQRIKFVVESIEGSTVHLFSEELGKYIFNTDKPAQAAACSSDSIPPLVIDGSNVVCADEKLSWRILRALINALKERNCQFTVFFDANIQHVLKDAGEMDGVLYLKQLKKEFPDDVQLCPAGNQADDHLLFAADKEGRHVLSLDRYGDEKFRMRYPWLQERDPFKCRLHKFMVYKSQLRIPDFDIDVPIC